MRKKYYFNHLELTGSLALEPKITQKGVFLRIFYLARQTKHFEKAKNYFLDVSCFGDRVVGTAKNLQKGDKIHIKGSITSYKDKVTGFDKMGIVAKKIVAVSKKQATLSPETPGDSQSDKLANLNI